ncbi:MAG: extracellular solute-binding protein [Propionibacteriales bacterium]|nr:extracellular solute-binding protein [Propionibacteriales bacterium]
MAMRIERAAVPAVVVLALGLAGCGSPTADEDASGSGDAEGSVESLDGVYAELEGLDGQERLDRLQELAAEEDAEVTWYTTTPLEDSEPMVDAFAEEYGIDVELFRASSSDLLQRLLQEADAGRSDADLVTNNGEELHALDSEGLLAPLETPLRDDIADKARFDTWLGIYLNVAAAAWNTDGLDESEYPTTWEEVLTDHPDSFALEAKAWDWFATLVQEYFVAEKGMTAKEAIDLFLEAAPGAAVVDGNTGIAELMAAGQYDLVTPTYKNHVSVLADDGAPVAWEPPVEPLILTVNGTGIHSGTDAPATSLLFTEYLLTGGQEILADVYRVPANTEYGGLPEEYETITVDVDRSVRLRPRWEQLYDEIIRESGSEIIEPD